MKSYDIFVFETETDESVLWLDAAITLEQAKARVSELANPSQSRFLILDQTTGARQIVTVSPSETLAENCGSVELGKRRLRDGNP